MNAKKVVKRILVGLVAVILILSVVAATVVFWYYPHYKSSAEPFDITQKVNEAGEITVMSANARCFTPTDFFKESWFYRADLFLENIRENEPDIIGFQEVTSMHYKYLNENLKGYESVIEYRDDTTFSEACPIYYRTDIYEYVSKGSFWLSETPNEMSIGWGAANYRICSYVILKEKATNQEFVVFNTHLDHVSEEARIKGIGVVLEHIKEFGDIPALLMGDLNALEGSVTYESTIENFRDAMYETDNRKESFTYQGFGKSSNPKRIDFMFVSSNDFIIDKYWVVDTLYDGVYPSDHFPICVKMKLNAKVSA